jgi:hypothetical protein
MHLSQLHSKHHQAARESPLSLGAPVGVRRSTVSLAVFLAVLCSSGILFVSFRPSAAQVLPPHDKGDRCRLVPGEKMAERCPEGILTISSEIQPQPANEMNSWRLVRTPNPAGGRDAVAAMRTADGSRSDLDFAGLMLRCGDVEPEVLVVLVRPLPIYSHPNIAIEADSSSVDLIATVVPPGLLVLLPSEATALAKGPWRRIAEVKMTVAEKGISISGVVLLAGLDAAMPQLEASCLAR